MKSQKSVLASVVLLGLTSALALGQAPATDSATTPANGSNPTPAAATSGSMPETATPAAKPATSNTLLPAPDTSTPAGGTVTGGLDAPSAVPAIQIQEMSARDRLIQEINSRMSAAENRLNELKSKAADLEDSDRKSIDAAWNDYTAAKQRLQQAIQNAKQAESRGWDRARAALASEYGFYAAAVGGVEVAIPN